MNLYDDLFPPQVFNANVKGHDEKGQQQNQLLPTSATLHLGHGFLFFLQYFTKSSIWYNSSVKLNKKFSFNFLFFLH